MHTPVRFISFLSLLFFITLSYYLVVTRTVPDNFKVGTRFLVNENESLKDISERLEKDGIVGSALWFRVWVSLRNIDKQIHVGYYDFKEEMTLGKVVKKFTEGADEPLAKITIPEGSTNIEIANILSKEVPSISSSSFLNEVLKAEATGFLFPETYYLLPSMSAGEIVYRMQNTFFKKFEEKFGISAKKGEDLKKAVYKDVVLASLLEGEAKTEEDMKIVAGILLKRLKIGMALQVDVARITYTIRGLPEKPINNPGLIAIDAAKNPTLTDYLYYITGLDGKMYYAKTFEEHKRNIVKYLR